MNTEPIIEISGLTKRFDYTEALADVNLQIHPGRIVGLLGANGSGKSTLIRHMIGLYLPDEGDCYTLGSDASNLGADQLQRIGYVHQEGELLDWMTAGQMVGYVAAHYRKWNKCLEEEYCSRFDLPLDGRVGAMSPGQRQKLAILLAIGHEPDLLILDEPAAALDPIARRRFLDLLLGIIQDPERTVIISSHILSDVEKVIDHVLVMNTGRLIVDCGFDDLREGYCRARVMSLDGELPDPLPFANYLECDRDRYQAMLAIRAEEKAALTGSATDHNLNLEFMPVPLEDIYRLVINGDGKGSGE